MLFANNQKSNYDALAQVIEDLGHVKYLIDFLEPISKMDKFEVSSDCMYQTPIYAARTST